MTTKYAPIHMQCTCQKDGNSLCTYTEGSGAFTDGRNEPGEPSWQRLNVGEVQSSNMGSHFDRSLQQYNTQHDYKVDGSQYTVQY